MKLAAIAASAALFGIMSIGPSTAAPASGSALKHTGVQDKQIVDVEYKKHRRHYRKGNRYGRNYSNRDRGGPPGWRRYAGRPSGWQTRGCLAVGPVWFCP